MFEEDDSKEVPVFGIITQLIITPLLFIYLLVGTLFRLYQNRETADHKTPYHSRKLVFRIILDSFLIFTYLLTIPLSYFFSSFWLSNAKSLSWIFLIAVASIGFEIRAILFCYYRRLALLRSIHLVSWSLILLAELSAIAYNVFERSGIETVGLVHDTLKGLLLLIRVGMQYKYPQDRDEFDDPEYLDEEASFDASRSEIIAERGTSLLWSRKKIGFEKRDRTFTDHVPKKKLDLTIHISKKVIQKQRLKGQGKEIHYQILIKTFGKQYKINRNLEEFQRLEQDLKQDFNSSLMSQSQQFGSLLGGLSVNDDPDSISSSVKILQNFLDGFLNSGEAIPIQLVNFLDIPESLRKKVLFWNQQQISMQKFRGGAKPGAQKSMGDNDLTSSNNFPEIENSLRRTEQESDSDEEEDEDSDNEVRPRGGSTHNNVHLEDSSFCPYFEVTIPKWQKAAFGDHYEFVISITLSENPAESWEIVKRYSDFEKLRNQLTKEIRGEPPRLPSKKVRHDQAVLIKRKNGLEKFLKIILNEKLFLKTQAVQDFIKLKKEYMSVIYGDEELQDFSNQRAEIRDNRIIVLDNKKPFTEFEIRIIEYSRIDPSLQINEQKIYKKFKDFEILHKSLQMRFSANSYLLPELPAKYNEFGSRTSVDSKMKGLEKYLNALFKLPKIGDSFAFRKFVSHSKKFQSMHGNAPKETDDKQGSKKNASKDEDINSLKIDSLISMRSKKHSDDLS